MGEAQRGGEGEEAADEVAYVPHQEGEGDEEAGWEADRVEGVDLDGEDGVQHG